MKTESAWRRLAHSSLASDGRTDAAGYAYTCGQAKRAGLAPRADMFFNFPAELRYAICYIRKGMGLAEPHAIVKSI